MMLPDDRDYYTDDPDYDPETDAQAREDAAVLAWEQDYERL